MSHKRASASGSKATLWVAAGPTNAAAIQPDLEFVENTPSTNLSVLGEAVQATHQLWCRQEQLACKPELDKRVSLEPFRHPTSHLGPIGQFREQRCFAHSAQTHEDGEWSTEPRLRLLKPAEKRRDDVFATSDNQRSPSHSWSERVHQFSYDYERLRRSSEVYDAQFPPDLHGRIAA
jgi:hypothetical protein